MGIYSDREKAKTDAVAALRAASTADARLAALHQAADAHLISPGWRQADQALLDALASSASVEVRLAWARLQLQLEFDRTLAKKWIARLYDWGRSLPVDARKRWSEAWLAWATSMLTT